MNGQEGVEVLADHGWSLSARARVAKPNWMSPPLPFGIGRLQIRFIGEAVSSEV
jgi:hypothetical protein